MGHIKTFRLYVAWLEKAMATHSSTLAWKIPWMEEPGRLQSKRSWRVTTERLHFYFSLSCIGEGNGNPVQWVCLENPRDGRAWWAAVYGVAQSRTRLKWLSSSSSSSSCMIRFPFRMIVPIVIQKGMSKEDIRTQKNREKTITTVQAGNKEE